MLGWLSPSHLSGPALLNDTATSDLETGVAYAVTGCAPKALKHHDVQSLRVGPALGKQARLCIDVPPEGTLRRHSATPSLSGIVERQALTSRLRKTRPKSHPLPTFYVERNTHKIACKIGSGKASAVETYLHKLVFPSPTFFF